MLLAYVRCPLRGRVAVVLFCYNYDEPTCQFIKGLHHNAAEVVANIRCAK